MRLALLCILFFSLLNAKASDYLPYEENGKYGLKDREGKVIIAPAFEGLGWSDGSFSMVNQITGYKLNNRWGLINLKAQRITAAEFTQLLPSGGDRIIVKKEINAISSKMGCIDLNGNITVPLKYDGIKILGLQAIVFNKIENKFIYGVIKLSGDIIIPLAYKNIYPIGSLRYGVYNNDNKAALFSETGIKLTDFIIDSISTFQNNRAIIYQGLNQGIISRDGLMEVMPQYREIVFENDGTLKARNMSQWMLMDSHHNIIRTTLCDELTSNASSFKVENGNQYGIWGSDFNPILPIAYDDIQQIDEDMVVAKRGNKFGLIQTNSSVVLPFHFDSIALSEKFVRVQVKLLGRPSWELYDIYGIRKSNRSYESIGAFNGKFFLIKNYGLSGIMDRYGKETVHCVYDSILDFNEEQIIVKFHGHYGIIDFKENWLLPPQPYQVQLVDENHYLQKEGGTTLFKTFDGELIYFSDYSLSLKGQTLFEILPDGTEKEISFQGVIVRRSTPPVMEETELVTTEHEGFRGIRRNGKYGFIDQQGRLRIANRYEAIGNFKDGLAPVKILGRWGFIDVNDRIAINPSYEYVSEFMKNIAIVKKGKFGFIDQSGNQILEPRYDSIQKIPTNNFLIYSNQLVGLANKDGEILIEPRFDNLHDLGNGFVIISRDNKFGLLTQSGLSTVPLIYDQLFYLPQQDKLLAKMESPWIKLNLN